MCRRLAHIHNVRHLIGIVRAGRQERTRWSQTAELARVKARIKALTEKTVANGCTEAEAMSAAEMVGRLLERYALNMDEIEVREARCVQAEVPIGGQRRRAIDACVPAIARFCDCKVWLRPAHLHWPACCTETFGR